MPKSGREIDPFSEDAAVLLYGLPGCGKTAAIPSFPKPIYILNLDPDGLRTIAGEDFYYDEFYDRADEKPFAWKEVVKAAKGLLKGHDYRTVALDSLTSLAVVCMNDIQALNRTTGKPPEIQEYLILNDRLKHFIQDVFLQIPGFRVLTAHLDITKDALTGEIWKGVYIDGADKYPRRLPAWFSEVYYMEGNHGSKGSSFTAMTLSRQKITCRTRFKGIEPIITWHPETAPLWPTIIDQAKKGWAEYQRKMTKGGGSAN